MRELILNLARYTVPTIGPVGGAAAQLAMSLVLLRLLDPAAFGSFSLLLVASQFSWGIWGALFCAPLPILAAGNSDSVERAVLRRAMFATCLASTVVASGAFFLLGIALGISLTSALLFACYSAVSLLRWFGRARAYVAGEPLRTMASDLAYATVLLAGVTAIAISNTKPFDVALAALLAGAVAGLLPLGRAYLFEQFVRVSMRDIGAYRAVWRQHSRWSLFGVLTTEATANSHVYIVTFASGPSAYAAIAASALLIRPINVIQNALGEFERAGMARKIGDRDTQGALASLRLFRIALVLTWCVTAIAMAALLGYMPRAIFPPHYTMHELIVGGGLWIAVAGIRLLRTPESVLLQAAGEFRSLAYASAVSCGWSIAAVIAFLVIGGPLWSIAGIAIGELICAVLIWRQARRWRKSISPFAKESLG